MNAVAISVSLLAVLFLIGWVVLHRMRRLRPQMAGYGAQRMCPACGLITPRAKAACLECGKVFMNPVRKRA